MIPTHRTSHPYSAAQSEVGEGAYIDTEAGPSEVPGAMPPPASEWSSVRRARPSNVLLPAARRWIESLPEVVRPAALTRVFPRLANRLALAWGDAQEAALLIDSLLVDRRGGRRGFPAGVVADLRDLRRYLVDLHPHFAADWTDHSR